METTNIMALYGEAIDTITKDGSRWAHFLDTAARIYKHNFLNQIIIYEQNPDVTACGTKAQWERFGRSLKDGAKQIGTLRADGEKFEINYVYDVSDTVNNDKRLPSDWNITEENEKNILDMLKIGHDREYTDTMTLKGEINAAVESLAAERIGETYEQFMAIRDGSWIGKEPDEVIFFRLLNCIEDTAEYMALRRCGFDVDHIEFNHIGEFDTLQTISNLGIAACGIARDVLVEIEKEARKTERSINHDRTELSGRSGRDNEAPARSEGDHSAAHEVRPDEKKILEGTDERGIPVLAGDGQPLRTLQGSGDQGAGHEGAGEERPARVKQTAGDGGLHGDGGVSERDRPPSGGNGAEGDRIQQGDSDDHHEEGIRQDGAEPEEEKSSGFSISGSFEYRAGDEVYLEDDRAFKVLEVAGEKVTVGDVEIPLLVRIMERQDFETLIGNNEKNRKKPEVKITQEDIDEVLRGSSKTGIRQYDIYSHFIHEKNTKNNVKYLKEKYGWSGQSWDFSDGSSGFIEYNSKGIEIRKYKPEAETLLKWPAAAKRIQRLISEGKYLPETEIALLPDYEEWTRASNLYLTFEHTIPMTEEKSIEFAKALNRYNLSTGSMVYLNGTEFQISEFGAECHLSAKDEGIFIDLAELKNRLAEDERNDYLLDLKDTPDFEAMGINQETAISFQKWIEARGTKPAAASLSPEKLDDIFDEYSPLFVSKILFDDKYMAIREGFRDAEAARDECGAAVKRIAATMSGEKELQQAYGESEGFRQRLEQYVFQQTYTFFAEYDHQTDVQTGKTIKPKSRLPMDAPHMNYRKMQKLFPAIMDGTSRYMQYGAGVAFDPLHVENDGDGHISLSHTYEQNGDVMYDPRMELYVDHKAKTVEAASFENSGLGLRQDVYPEEGKYIPRLRKELNSFLKQWLKNISDQGYEPVRATIVRDGEDVEISEFENGTPVIPAAPEQEKKIIEPEPETKIVKFPLVLAEGKLTAPPYVRIVWSEHPIFEDGEKLSVAEAEYLFRELDHLIIKARQDAAERGERVNWSYFKTRFSVVLEIDGQEEPLETRYNFGDGQGSLTEIFRSDAEQMLNDSHLRNNLTSEEIEAQESIFSQIVPYLEQFTELAAQDQMILNTRLAEYRTEEAARNFLGLDEPKPDAEYGQISEEEFEQAIKQQQQETAAIRPEKKYELGFGYLGNGLTVWNRLEEEQQGDESNLINPEPQPEQSPPDNQQEPIWTPIEGGEVTQVMIDLTPSDEKEQKPEKINYRITDEHYGEATAKMRFEKNMDAIFILREVESENRLATPEEQEILAGYTGWGAIPQAFDENNKKWSKEYERLKDELSPEEYHSARASVLNAHYTTPVVIRAVYKALENMGLEGGNICDPACGIGNFFGAAPESLERARFYGVELDSLTARIAKQLYQKANIRQSGFEDTDFGDNFFDVFIGNIPFGEYKVTDQRYAKENFLIHDYFFAHALDKVRPGGVVAFLTSKGTMDKANPSVRKYLAEQAELLGAIRLPNNAFKANAGTEVTIDILFLQKRERRISIEPGWVHLDKTEDGIPVNSYFADHPEMVLGKIAFWKNMYGRETDTACLPIEGADLGLQLEQAIQYIEGEIVPADPIKQEKETVQDTIPADPAVKNFCYTVFEGKIYYREDSEMHRMYFSANTEARVRGLCKIREVVRELIDAQMNGHSDEKIKEGQQHLNYLYDSFVKKHGRINSRGNSLAFRGDTDYPLLCSLEVLDEEDHFKEKAAFFSRRTIRPPKEITSVQTAQDALLASMAERGRVDLPYMETLYPKDKQQIISELCGQIFKDPLSEDWLLKDEYLSGNVRKKLAEAQEAAVGNPEYTENIEALLQVQPEDIPAEEIDVKIGSIWVSESDYKQFIVDMLDLTQDEGERLCVGYSSRTGGWRIWKKPYLNVIAKEIYGTNRKNAYEIMEAALNLRLIEVRDRVEDDEGKVRYVLNVEDTIAAQSKQAELQEKFREWIFEDTERRERLVRKYNDTMNNIVPREYDGKYIRYHGMNPEINMRDYQRNVDARILYGGNTLIGHVVGSGKTFEIVAAIPESKYLGICHKAMICVPNHLLMQWAGDYLRLYPAANILVVTAKDFEKERRRKFCARIATGEYDAVIIGHSQLAKIPMSKKWEEEYIQSEIDEIIDGIAEAKERNDEHWSIKRMEGMRKNLEARIERLNTIPRDNVLDFEELGVDMLIVDESQEFKNLMFNTKMRNVAGVSQANSKRASDLYMKCRYLNTINGNRGIVFATGTPISNTIAEMYTLQRYLQYDELEARGLTYFDAWVSVFAEVRTTMELAPSGRGFRLKTRLSTYYNIEELSNMFALVADIKTAEDIQIPVPKIRGGEPENVVVSPSALGEKLIDSCVKRTEKIRKKMVRPDQDNMLLVTNDGRKIALDVRCYDPSLPDEEGNKVSACAGKVFEIWEESTDDRAAQLVFCDQSTPKNIVMQKNEQGEFEMGETAFSVYGDLKEKLVAKGIPASEIAFIHEANSDAKKAKLFAKVRKGSIRVLIGSTFMMGAGTNVQDRLIALHHLDAPWRPSDLIQREGRILRWGNLFPEVRILRYLTERSFDAYIYQLLENKQRFTNQIISNKPPARRMDDVDIVSEMLKQIKAIATGDPRVIRKSELDTEIMRVQVLKRQYKAKRFRLQSLISELKQDIDRNRKRINSYEQDMKTIQPYLASGFKMTVKGIEYQDKKKAGKALHMVMPEIADAEGAAKIGSFMGFGMNMEYIPDERNYVLYLHGKGDYECELKKDEVKDIERISSLIRDIPILKKSCLETIDKCNKQILDAEHELDRPFEKERELQDMMQEVTQLNHDLDLDHDEPIVVEEEPDVEIQSEDQDYEPEYVR